MSITMAKLWDVARPLITKGAKTRMVLKGEQLAMLPAELKPLVQNVENPVVHLGINGRGAEGSIYGIKVFAKGNKKPVAAMAGRIDYREPEPILQLNGFMRKNTGEGEALRAKIMMDTNQPINIEGMDQFMISKAKGNYALTARSSALNADITMNEPATREMAGFMGFKNFSLIPERGLKGFERFRENISASLKKANPLGEKPTVQPLDVSVKNGAEDIENFLKAERASINASEIQQFEKSLSQAKEDMKHYQEAFERATDKVEKASYAKSYASARDNVIKYSKEIEYLKG